MKSIQEVLRTFDIQELAMKFITAYSSNIIAYLGNPKYNCLTITEAIELREKEVKRFIKMLSRISLKDNPNDRGVLFIYEDCNSDDLLAMGVAFRDKDKGNTIRSFNLEIESFTNWEVAMGYLVADNELTQDNLDFLVLDFLYKASFFGFTKKEITQNIDTEHGVILDPMTGLVKAMMTDNLSAESNEINIGVLAEMFEILKDQESETEYFANFEIKDLSGIFEKITLAKEKTFSENSKTDDERSLIELLLNNEQDIEEFEASDAQDVFEEELLNRLMTAGENYDQCCQQYTYYHIGLELRQIQQTLEECTME